jgi:cardiolipin synthase
MELTHDITLVQAARAIIQPEHGSQPVLDLINGAEKTIRLKMFTFTSDDIAMALIAAQARGVAVRVMLNPARSSGSRANDDMRAGLQAGSCTVIWSSPAFAVTHVKSMVVDSRSALIATFNFGVMYFTATRDYGIVRKIRRWLPGSRRVSRRTGTGGNSCGRTKARWSGAIAGRAR